jgi:hypothetical protein
VHAQLRIAANRVTSVEKPSSLDELSIKEIRFYNMAGQLTTNPSGLVIKQTIYTNGTVITTKEIK